MENSDVGGSERGGIITARGTGEGLVIRLDGRVDRDSLKHALNDFLVSRKGFLSGNEVILEWVGSLGEESLVNELSDSLQREFKISVKASRLWEQVRSDFADEAVPSEPGLAIAPADISRNRTPSLFDGIEVINAFESGASPSSMNEGFESNKRSSSSGSARIESIRGAELRGVESRSRAAAAISADRAAASERGASSTSRSSFGRGAGLESGLRASSAPVSGSAPIKGNMALDSAAWDDPDARIEYATLRSGQKIETEHSLIVFGDVNSGAEIVAGGDVVVLGALRGVAHAGAYDETGGGRVIFALDLQPTQLRIGTVISRGATVEQNPDRRPAAEVARVEGNMIVVEPYLSRAVSGRRKS